MPKARVGGRRPSKRNSRPRRRGGGPSRPQTYTGALATVVRPAEGSQLVFILDDTLKTFDDYKNRTN